MYSSHVFFVIDFTLISGLAGIVTIADKIHAYR